MSDYIKRADAIEAVAQEWLSEASAESPYVNDDDIGEYRKLAKELFEDVPSADAVPQSEQYKKGFEDAKRAFLVEYARESENMRKRNAQLEVMLNAQKVISAEAVQGEWEPWGSPFSDESEVIDTIVCSVCGARFIEPKDEPKGEYNFCPSCGARMKGGEE